MSAPANHLLPGGAGSAKQKVGLFDKERLQNVAKPTGSMELLPSPLKLFSLEGKTAVVTGACGGIGLVLTAALAGAGADIISIQMPNDPLSVELERTIRDTGRELRVFECDLLDIRSLAGVFDKIWSVGITPSILLNVAGVQFFTRIEDTTPDDLDRIFDVNCKAAYMITKEFGLRLIKQKQPGKIVHIASMSSYLPQTEISAYASSKAAVVNMCRAFSNEWAHHGIRVNSISPGFIQTKASEVLHSDKEFNEYVCRRTSAGRWGLPEDLVGTAIFLSSRASDWITGADILIDGGVVGR